MTVLDVLNAHLMASARATVTEILAYLYARQYGRRGTADRARCAIEAIAGG
jgi:hypothetical protein